MCQDYRRVVCDIECNHAAVENTKYDAYLSTYQRLFVVNHQTEESGQNTTSPSTGEQGLQLNTQSSNINFELCLADQRLSLVGNKSCAISCLLDAARQPDCVTPETFWTFVLLMCVGTIGYNVANCVSDATCFDMLGELEGVLKAEEHEKPQKNHIKMDSSTHI